MDRSGEPTIEDKQREREEFQEEFDRLAKEQQEETDPKKRLELIFQAQHLLAEDLPSWHVCSRDAINPVNKKLFKNFKPSKISWQWRRDSLRKPVSD